MNTTTAFPADTQATTSAAAQHTPSKAPRFDMYCFIHKALRQYMAHTLRGLGALDASEADERNVVLDNVDGLLAMLRSHLQHENDFVHTAIEARQPGGARETADDHLEHQEAIRNLEDESRALRDAHDEHRPQLALRLYRHLAAFVGENLVHMQVEETRNNATLWALYSDEELVAIHDRLVASIRTGRDGPGGALDGRGAERAGTRGGVQRHARQGAAAGLRGACWASPARSWTNAAGRSWRAAWACRPCPGLMTA